jgi:hypothetical protein
VTITDFLKSGGDGYSTFAAKPAEYTGLPLRELVVEAFRSRRTVSAAVEGRILRLPYRQEEGFDGEKG